MNKNCNSACFIGHRWFKGNRESNEKISERLEKLINKGIKEYYSCGTEGFDIVCCIIILGLKKKYPDVRLNLFLPCEPAIHAKGRSIRSKLDYYRVVKNCDNVKIGGSRDRLTELCGVCFCYYNYEERTKTAEFIEKAEKNKLEIINLF